MSNCEEVTYEVTFVANANDHDDFAKIDFTKPLLGQMGYDEIDVDDDEIQVGEIHVDPAWEDFGKIIPKIMMMTVAQRRNLIEISERMKLASNICDEKDDGCDDEDDYEEYLQGKTIFMPNEVKVIKKYKDDDEFWNGIDSILKGDRTKLRQMQTDDVFVTMNGDQVFRRQVGSITFYTFTMKAAKLVDSDSSSDDD